MKSKHLQEADQCGKNQSSGERKRQCAVVDLLLAFVTRAQEAHQKENSLTPLPKLLQQVAASGKMAAFVPGRRQEPKKRHQYRSTGGWNDTGRLVQLESVAGAK